MGEEFSATILNSRLPYLFGNEIEYFHSLAEKLTDDSVVVCLGTGPGIMLMALTENNDKNFELVSVDIGDYYSAMKHLEMIGKIDRAGFIVNDSSDEALKWQDESVSVLLVDACHQKTCVEADIKAWWKKVKYNGLVFFHDFIKKEDDNGVEQAINECKTAEWQEIARPGISIVYKKVKADA